MAVYNPKTRKFDDEENQVRDSKASVNVYKPSSKSFEEIQSVQEQQDNNGWFKKSSGNAVQTVAGTTADVGYNAFIGPGKKMESWENSLFYWLGDLFQGLGWDSAANIAKKNAGQSRIDNTMAPVKEIIEPNSVLGERADALTQNITGTAYQAALTSAIPGGVAGQTAASSAMMFAEGYSNARTEALNEGATEEEAKAYANIAGLAEAGTELMFGGLGKFNKAIGISKSGLPVDDVLATNFSKTFKSRLAKNLAEYGIKAAGEGFEEVASGVLQAIGKKLTYKKEEDIQKLIEDQDLLEQFIDGAIVSGIMQIPGENGIIKSTKADKDFVTGYTTNEQNLVDKVVDTRIKEKEDNGEKVYKSEIKKQVERDLEKGYIDLEDIEKSLGGDTYTQYEEAQQKQENIQKQIDEYKKMKDNDITVEQREEYNKLKEELSNQTKTVENLGKQLRSYVNELTQNDSLIRNSYNEYANKGNAYNIDLSQVKESQRDTYQRAMDSGVLNNTNRSHDFVDLIAKLEEEKGVKFDFTNNEKLKDTRFALDGVQVNGYIDGDNIVLNMDTDKALNSVIGHEITHVLEGTDLYESLQNAVKEYATTKGEYEVKLNDLRELYKEVKDANIERELTADFIGDYLFTDEEFVKKLSTQNRNLFEKIYDEIKYLAKLITSGSKEGRQLEKLKHTFEKVYRQQSANIPNNTKYKVTNDNGEPITFLRYQKNALDMSDDFDYNQSDVSHKTGFGINFSDSDMYTKGKDSKDVLKTTITSKKGLLTDTNTKVPKKQIDALNEVFNKYIPDVTMFSDDITDGQLIDQINTASELIANAEDNNTGRKAYVEFYNVINKDGYIRTEPDGSKLLSVLSKESIDAFNNTNTKSDQNVKYSISQDNQGRKLSKQQQEYFKDSKVRDKNGRLIEVYHGTPNEFTKFNYDKLGTNGTLLGKGFYLTDDINVSEAYANKSDNGKIMKLYADIQKPLKWGEKSISKSQYKDFVEAINEETNGTLFADYSGEYSEKGSNQYNSTLNDILMDYEYGGDDIDLISGLLNSTGMSWEKAYRILKDVTGYDGIIVTKDVYDSGEGNVYIPFLPNQIKNVDNTNPTTNEDIRYSISNQNEDIAPIGNYRIKGEDIKLQDIAPIELPQLQEINPNDVYAQFGRTIENDNINGEYQPITTEETQNRLQEFPTINNDNFVENLLLQQERKANAKNEEKQQALNNRQMEIDTNKRSGLKDKLSKAWRTWQYLTTNSNTEIDHLSKETNNPRIKHTGDMLNNFMAEAQNDISSYQTDNYGRKIGKSVQELFTKAKENGLENAFNDYLLHYSNIDRHSTGKGSKIPSAVSESLVKAYEEKYPQFKTWGKDVWQFGKNALNNMYEAGLIGEEQRDVLNKIYPHYVPFFENRDLSNYINSTGELKTKNTIKKSRGGATQENLMPVEEALAKYAYSQKKSVRQNDLYKEIVNTLTDARENIDGNFNFDNATLDNLYADENGNYLTAFIDGNPVSVRINQELYDGLKNDMANNIKNLEEKFSLITKPLQKASEINRNILTSWSPTFPITNAIKDFQDALINSKDVKGFIKQYPSAIKELAQNKTELAHQFQALYGAGNIMGDYEIDVNKGKNKNFLRRITRINDIIELAPRFAEFKSSLEKGQSLQEAMYNAREVTTNFGRGGVITKAMNRNGFRFLNASVQGFSKFVRNFSGENGAKGVAAALAKATAFGIAPALFNELAFGGGGDDKDEQYDALPDYIKDNYYLIKTGDGNFVRIPKGRALSVFGSAARRTMELAEGEENAFEGYLDNVNSQTGFNNPEENNIFSPLIQAFGSENGEAWYGGDLVPTRLQSKPQAEQYDETTDEFSKWLGGVLNVSPYKINYVLDQYTGGAGDIALPLMTKEATSEADNPLGIALAPLKNKFAVDSTSDNKYVSDFYDTNEKVKIAANSAFATEKDKLQQKYMSEVSSELAELYKQKREVQNDESLSRSERFKKSQAIKDQINEIAKSGLQNKDSMSVESNYATVGDKSFYKNTKNEWKTISKDELEDISSIGMTDKERSNYFGAKNNISAITDKYKKQLEGRDEDEDNSEIYNAKKKEIANVVKNSKLTDREKAYLYDKYYGDTRTLNALVDIGMDMDKYIDFDSQLFESDKYANGKTVANSKRNKVFNYINSMDIPYEQRLLLAKLKYNSFDEGNYDIIQYLNNSNISYDDEAKLLKKLGFKVSSDGSVRW